MSKGEQLRAIRGIARLHELRVRTAEAALLRAADENDAAARRTEDHVQARDEANGYWDAELDAKRPNPHVIAMARDWLIGAEDSLHAARLDQGIAEAARDEAKSLLARGKAHREVMGTIEATLRREIVRSREERRVSEASDFHLRRKMA